MLSAAAASFPTNLTFLSLVFIAVRYRTLRLVRSATVPTNCPHAAPISSARVVRTVTVKPAFFKISLKFETDEELGRSYLLNSKVLNGIKLILQGKEPRVPLGL